MSGLGYFEVLGDRLRNVLIVEFDARKVAAIQLENVFQGRDVLVDADFVAHFGFQRNRLWGNSVRINEELNKFEKERFEGGEWE